MGEETKSEHPGGDGGDAVEWLDLLWQTILVNMVFDTVGEVGGERGGKVRGEVKE